MNIQQAATGLYPPKSRSHDILGPNPSVPNRKPNPLRSPRSRSIKATIRHTSSIAATLFYFLRIVADLSITTTFSNSTSIHSCARSLSNPYTHCRKLPLNLISQTQFRSPLYQNIPFPLLLHPDCFPQGAYLPLFLRIS